jgi:PKD repeat protein
MFMKLTFRVLSIALLAGSFLLSSCDTNEVRLCFKADKQYPKAMERVTFSAACSENIDLYHWNFGDGIDTITKGSSVEHVFVQDGYYTVTLHNTDASIADHCPPGGAGVVASTSIEVMP